MKTGIAGRSAEVVALLRARGYTIDVYVDEPVARLAPDTRSAHDFVWRHASHPYDLTVYQFGNSSHHDYEWPYAVRYPGLVVLHDARLHHARAAALLRERRAAEYRIEFAWNHPAANPDLSELAIRGLDSTLYYEWPMARTLVAASKLTAVHGEGTADDLRTHFSDRPELAERIVSIRLGEGEVVAPARRDAARARVLARHGLPADAVLFGVFGGLTPEKRIDQVVRAFAAVRRAVPAARLVLAGAEAPHYDVRSALAAHRIVEDTILTGYLASDEELTDSIAACDVTLNLRWPTTRETSGPWLRALAAGRATVITDLVHVSGVPAFDPRTWTSRGSASEPVCVAIDILDEDHSLRLAMQRLASDVALRERLGAAAARWWEARHTPAGMADDYERVMAAALERPAPEAALPAHALDRADGTLRQLLAPFGDAVSECIREI